MKEICQTADIDFDHWKHLNVKKNPSKLYPNEKRFSKISGLFLNYI